MLWSHVLSQRRLFIVCDSISLSPLDEAKWHAWRRAAGRIVPRRLGVTLNNVKPQSGLVRESPLSIQKDITEGRWGGSFSQPLWDKFNSMCSCILTVRLKFNYPNGRTFPKKWVRPIIPQCDTKREARDTNVLHSCSSHWCAVTTTNYVRAENEII